MFVREVVALFVFSVGLLSLELSYTKIFSVLLWYHFGFLIVSTAMLGFAGAGVALALLGERRQRFSFFALITLSALAVMISYAPFTAMASSITMSPTAGTMLRLLAIVVMLLVPFFLLGMAVSWIIDARRARVGVVYGANLLGSGVGAVLFIFLFDHFPGDIVPYLNVLLILLAAVLVVQKWSQAVAVAVVALLAVMAIPATLRSPPAPAAQKPLGGVSYPEREVLFSRWSSLARVDIFTNPDWHIVNGAGLWGISTKRLKDPKPLPQRLGVVIDASAYTTILRLPQDLSFYEHLPSAYPFQIGQDYDRSVHIGAGGGMDLVAANHYGVEHVDGVEINGLMVDAIRTVFNDFSGGVYAGGLDGVQVHVSEGRSFLERQPDPYDLIQLSGVDTQSSSQAGAFALSENYLYTTEAFVTYLERLTPNGMLHLTRWHLPDKAGKKTYSLRMMNIAREALETMGLDPKGRIFYFRGGPQGPITSLAVKTQPFSPEEIKLGYEFVNRNGFRPMIIPGQTLSNIYEEFLYAPREEYDRLVGEYPYIISPPTDNRPFIFELQRFASVFRNDDWPVRGYTITGQEILIVLLVELLLVGAALLLLPLRILRKRADVQIPWRANAYFAAIGFGYITIEIVLSQKLVLYLGHPTYALSVVIAGMLVFSGIASTVSNRAGPKILLWGLVPALVLVGFGLSPLLDLTLRAGFVPRLLVVIATIAPLAFLMGLPFPLGLQRTHNDALPFLWGVNGFFSVVGSVLAVMISINFGFFTVFALAALAYMGAALILRRPEPLSGS
jgi:hypothetical protein